MKAILFISLLGLIFTLGACKSNNNIDSNIPPSNTALEPSHPTEVELIPNKLYEIGEKAPTVAKPYIFKDESFNIIDSYGKLVILNFWYYSCGPCISEIPAFSRIAKEFEGDLTIACIHEGTIYKDYSSLVKEFINKSFTGFNVSFLYDDYANSLYYALGGKDRFPLTIFLDRAGTIIAKYDQPFFEYELREVIKKLL